MTNAEKNVTNGERFDAFDKWCKSKKIGCTSHFKSASLFTHWLDEEFKEEHIEILHCPFCGGSVSEAYDCSMVGWFGGGWYVHCKNCGYRSKYYRSKNDAIVSHNILLKNIMEI